MVIIGPSRANDLLYMVMNYRATLLPTMVNAQADIAQASVEQAIAKECKLFSESSDILTKAKSLAGLSILVTQLDVQGGGGFGQSAGLPPSLASLLPELLRLVGDTSDEHLQKNSIALLTSISAASEAAWQHLLQADYVSRIGFSPMDVC